jgi:hypothetical protein
MLIRVTCRTVAAGGLTPLGFCSQTLLFASIGLAVRAVCSLLLLPLRRVAFRAVSMSSLRDGWLPLVEYSYLPLPHFANCYSTASCSIARATADGPRRLQQVFVASAHEVFAVRCGAPSIDAAASSRSPSKASSLVPLQLARIPIGSELLALDAFEMSDGRPVLCVAVGLLAAQAQQSQSQAGATPSAAQVSEFQKAKASVPTRFSQSSLSTE